MYQLEKNTRIYMKGADGSPSRSPSSRSPLQELAPAHHKSQNGLNGRQSPGNQQHHSQTYKLKDSQQRAVSQELGELKAPGAETRTKSQVARAFKETQELIKTADSKAGLQTVKTRRVLKKTTTLQQGENEKLEDNSNFREILLRWAQKTTDGYPGCKVTDLTKSWRDGLALNAIIHRNRPDLLDYLSCREKSPHDNVDQAFTVADRDLGVSRLLDIDDVTAPCPDERSMITYLSQLYELFPNPPERNPLLDAEMRRRIDAHKELAKRLLKWIKDSTIKLEDRHWVKEAAELKRLLDEDERWLRNEVPPKEEDKRCLAREADEIYRFADDLGMKFDRELHIDNINHHWDRMMAAFRARQQALNDELGLVGQLNSLLDRLLKEIAACHRKLDDIEREIADEQRRLSATDLEGLRKAQQVSPAKVAKIRDELEQVGVRIEAIKRLADDFCHKAGRGTPDAVMVRDKVAELEARYKKIKLNFKQLEDDLESAMRKLRELEEAEREAQRKAERQRQAEAKFRLKLGQMKRELDELERRLNNMAPVAKDLDELQRQLQEMEDFNEQLQKAKRNLDELEKFGEDLIAEDLIADPAKLRHDVRELRDQWKRIADKADKRVRDIQDAMSRVAASDEIQEMAKWLARARKNLVDEEQVHGDLDTVNALVEQHKAFQDEIQARQPQIERIRRMEQELSSKSPQNGALIRDELSSLSSQWREIERMNRDKSARLDEASKLAEQMHKSVHQLLEWLADAEMKLRFAGSMPQDEAQAREELAEHERFERKLESQGQNKDSTLKIAQEILSKCHPDAEPVVKHWINILGSRWEEIDAWAKQRGRRLADHLKSLQELLKLVEELVSFLSRHEGRLLAEESDGLPESGHQLDQMIEQHATFMDELRRRDPDVDRVVKIFGSRSSGASSSTSKVILSTTTTSRDAGSSRRVTGGSRSPSVGRSSLGGARSTTPTQRTSYASYRDEYPEVREARAKLMLDKWRAVWQLALDKMQRLKDRAEHLRELERLENFDFDQWRRRFLSWVNQKKGRVIDFYRSIDDDNDGRIPVDAFVSNVLRSKFESSRLEMERVAAIIDKNNDGSIDSREFLDSLRPDKPVTDDELIQDEVQRQVARCTCAHKFRVYHVGEGRYRFGENQILRLVRILRSTVMVRVGGGWEPLGDFLQKNDPCRARGRTNIELREQFILPEGASQAMAAFRSRMSKDPGSMPHLGPITKIREKTDRSMPMGASSQGGSRYGSPSDYYSEHGGGQSASGSHGKTNNWIDDCDRESS